jgi:hypothetical protein
MVSTKQLPHLADDLVLDYVSVELQPRSHLAGANPLSGLSRIVIGYSGWNIIEQDKAGKS